MVLQGSRFTDEKGRTWEVARPFAGLAGWWDGNLIDPPPETGRATFKLFHETTIKRYLAQQQAVTDAA